MNRVALLGGAYSNERALVAVVADAQRRGADGIYFLGDAGGFGPHPDRTVEALRRLPIVSIQGNYDEAIGNARTDCACGYTDPRDQAWAQLSFDYTLERTSAGHRAWLAALPATLRLRVGVANVLLCHGSPRRQNEFLWESTTPRGFIDRLCTAAEADLIACTHTGLHWERRLDGGRGVVNVGAVGRPANDGRRCVWYALLEAGSNGVETTFVPVDYDWEALVRDMESEGLPGEFAETIATGWWTTCLEVLPARERSRGRF
jgi:diadenosine tetraphosphatase ApaH/serine/threonine PP2A family protein phosphatase